MKSSGKRRRELHELVFGVVLAVIEQAVVVIRNARRVGEQVAHGDVAPRAGASSKNFAIGSRQRQLAVLHLQHHGGGRELLAEGSGLKDGVGR